MEQARQEDALREADRVDPDVNHRADDYAPPTPSMGTSSTGSGTTEPGYDTSGTTGTTGTDTRL